jgi:hypothetical protein
MKRATGLDKEGRPMTVMGGIAYILRVIKKGRMILAYSGGLHHVQIPGQTFPKLFKTLKINYENLDIEQFIKHCQGRAHDEESFKHAVTVELQSRMKKNIPL